MTLTQNFESTVKYQRKRNVRKIGRNLRIQTGLKLIRELKFAIIFIGDILPCVCSTHPLHLLSNVLLSCENRMNILFGPKQNSYSTRIFLYKS
eukprot:snap_masked-scaffold_35-processed-gene-2.1-mRNA-1 protein AED:1.00 eAED:1.00 QI:0/0/0/0/1/1/2/0/92